MARPKEIVSYNMSRIRSRGTKLEDKLEKVLLEIGKDFEKQPQMFGKPDFVYRNEKIAVFADSDFWHGFDWETKKVEIKTNKEFWLKKIERNMERDKEVTQTLENDGWKVIRIWGHDIQKNPEKCREIIAALLH